jgi:4-amino-4-deoxy-L-arabinose transferase-like glycosyltransferase
MNTLRNARFWLFLLALTLRLLYLASFPPDALLESVDARGYDLLARNLVASHGFSLQDAPPYQPDGLRTPLYPLFVAAVYVLAGPRPVAVALLQALLDSLTALLVAAIVARLIGRRAGIAAALLYALTPVQWRYTAALLTEIPLAFLISLAVWLLCLLIAHRPSPPSPHLLTRDRQIPAPFNLLTRHRPGPPPHLLIRDRQIPAPFKLLARDRQIPLPPLSIAIACGAAAGLAALCKPNLVALGLILALAAFWALHGPRRQGSAPDPLHRNRRAGFLAAAILLAPLAVVSPWILRNWAIFGRPFLSNASLGFVARVSAPATLGVVEGHQVPPWSPEWEARYHALVTQAAARHGWRLESGGPLSPRQADRRERQIAQAAWEILLDHPGAALRAHLTGFLRSWAPQEQAFWHTHLSGRPWERLGVAANTYRDAVEILCDGRPWAAFQFAFIKPWARLDPFGRMLWYAWGVGHLLAPLLLLLGAWRLRHWPALALALAATILYATLPPGPIGYVRFRVPVVPLITVLEVAGIAWLSSRLRRLPVRSARDILTPLQEGDQ